MKRRSAGSTGDRQGRFSLVFQDAYLDLLRFVERRVPAEAAEDVVADVFLVAWRRWDAAPGDSSECRAWLFGIARNCLLNARRSQARRDALEVRALVDLAPADDPADATAARVDLAAAWRRLKPGEQEALALVTLDGVTPAQAARVLGVSSTAFRLRLMRARRALRHALHAEASLPTAHRMETIP